MIVFVSEIDIFGVPRRIMTRNMFETITKIIITTAISRLYNCQDTKVNNTNNTKKQCIKLVLRGIYSIHINKAS